MTTPTLSADTDVRPDVRVEVHAHRHRRRTWKPSGLLLTSPWWLVAIVAAAVSLLLTLGAVSYAIPQAA